MGLPPDPKPAALLQSRDGLCDRQLRASPDRPVDAGPAVVLRRHARLGPLPRPACPLRLRAGAVVDARLGTARGEEADRAAAAGLGAVCRGSSADIEAAIHVDGL